MTPCVNVQRERLRENGPGRLTQALAMSKNARRCGRFSVSMSVSVCVSCRGKHSDACVSSTPLIEGENTHVRAFMGPPSLNQGDLIAVQTSPRGRS